MRVLIDTNVFISHLLHPVEPERSTYRLVQFVLERGVTHILPIELLEELDRTIPASPYLEQRISVNQIQLLREALLSVSEVVSLRDTPIIPILRDPKDDYLLTASWKFSVDILVTGDRDLLDIRQHLDQPRILTAAEFLALDRF